MIFEPEGEYEELLETQKRYFQINTRFIVFTKTMLGFSWSIHMYIFVLRTAVDTHRCCATLSTVMSSPFQALPGSIVWFI